MKIEILFQVNRRKKMTIEKVKKKKKTFQRANLSSRATFF